MLKCYSLSFLMITIVFSCLIREVKSENLRNVKNTINIMKDSSMENFNLDCLDQLILVIHLQDVSVTNTNDYLYLL